MEAELLATFPLLIASQWIEFNDSNGRGNAQPDFYVLLPNHILCFEAKLTQNLRGYLQISKLYRPLLSHIYKLPVVGILVCKHLTQEPEREVKNAKELLDISSREITYTWHYVP